jgi:hypothetical protein
MAFAFDDEKMVIKKMEIIGFDAVIYHAIRVS